MKNVLLKSTVLILFITFYSCDNEIDHGQLNTTNSKSTPINPLEQVGYFHNSLLGQWLDTDSDSISAEDIISEINTIAQNCKLSIFSTALNYTFL